jgi:hypothetical protein
MYFIYVNSDSAIDHVLIEPFVFLNDDRETVITQEQILHIIQHKKTRVHPVHQTVIKYSLKDILCYTVELEPQHIQHYAQSDISECCVLSRPFLKTCNLFDAITIPSSIFVFHSLNALYFIMQEREREQPPPIVVKSILKKQDKTKKRMGNASGGGGGGGDGSGLNHTKKVSIVDATTHKQTQHERHKNMKSSRQTRKQKPILISK